ncbi:MAG: lipid-A-disaccharide synthase [Bacteroidales bacterium]|nr:lipid-A-disaccharide synthase [Bacteroidales bacterium]MCM1147622.1 lipid-A-disaccharide synthase [Bacteroidales bacterium]MCM1206413.1 lipid-A-disaccharide synthase [Bacillota bacterium]MCM1509147.1 lipid-A-disaccharide synthase [Clostridium sp.]
MKYYLIAGEASGDLHAAHLMTSLKHYDKEAEFRFIGGDNMLAAGGTMLRHYKDIAYMGFIPVLTHLRTIFNSMSLCKKDILEWQPDIVIPVDYAGFNLNICKWLRGLKTEKSPKVFYYIAPKIWAWKEYRIKNFKRDVDEMFCILPFEVDFFHGKHSYPVHYVGNPTADEVRKFKSEYKESKSDFCIKHGLDPKKPIVALLPGSRKQEISDNLKAMLKVAKELPEYQFVVAKAPSVNIGSINVAMVQNATYELLSHSTAALVTSGTATLETALFNVPQVVCYKTPVPRITRWAFEHIIKCKFISLVNLIGGKEIVPELFADRFSVRNISNHLAKILPGGNARERMLAGYNDVHARLGDISAPDNAAKIMTSLTGR